MIASWEKHPSLTAKMIEYILANGAARGALKFAPLKGKPTKVDGSRGSDHHRTIAQMIFHENEEVDNYKEVPIADLAGAVRNRLSV
jgi:hypothetical protein